ncbi:hypothetical protein [Fischerella sp. PCC 9605]|uniref:hypothetical protein n=1 Tax=Fischerella sp. PCC 9605 TaxID=1173024 RepID=UPI00047A4F13|nr:hypothetical protein [Fischerella sp. PCC 9605]
MAVIDTNRSYTFSNYSELRIDPIDLAEYFSYSIRRTTLQLPQYQGAINRLETLTADINDILPRLVTMNEQAKREMLIAPIVRTVVQVADALVRVEYPVNVSNQLQGNLDYLLSIDNLGQLLVIEAKRDDLDYGFTQLIAELIALDLWERSPKVEQQPELVGAITTGQIWQFAVLDREAKHLDQGLDSYVLPRDIETLLRILVQSLTRKQQI